MVRRVLLASAGGAGAVSSSSLLCAYNGQTGTSDYKIGVARSTDYGVTWTKDAANPVLGPVAATWESLYVKDASVVWDGSQYVMYYAGTAGSGFKIGRATSPDGTTWTRYGSNPVLALGSSGAFDEVGLEFPVVTHDASLSPAWRMWYMGYPAGADTSNPTGVTIGYADSSDGLSWTKRGRVLNVGTSGDLDDSGLATGCVLQAADGSGRLYYSGYRHSTNFFRTMSATFTTNPASSGNYTKQGVITGYDATFTIAGRTWRSNQPRTIVLLGARYRVLMSLWNPSDSSGYEMATGIWASDATTWDTPTAQMFTIPGSGWDSVSAENPSAIAA